MGSAVFAVALLAWFVSFALCTLVLVRMPIGAIDLLLPDRRWAVWQGPSSAR